MTETTCCPECEARFVAVITNAPLARASDSELHPSCAGTLARLAKTIKDRPMTDRAVRVAMAHGVICAGLEAGR